MWIDAALTRSIAKTETYLAERRFKGYDPYDALASPLFKLPLLGQSRALQRAAQQALRRLPVNIRPLLGIRPGYNPVTLGLAIQAYSYLAVAQPEHVEYHRTRALHCLSELHRLQSPGYSGACWGYDFGWQTREGFFPAGTPTIVATGFVTNGLFVSYRLLGLPEALELCQSACQFLKNDLPRTTDDDGALCWSYSPLDQTAVLNATMKGARLLAQVYSATGDDELRTLAERSARFTVRRQRPDGSWPYSVGDERTWADNFHTGYVLECLREYAALTGDTAADTATLRGWQHYRTRFFTKTLIPRYFDDRTYPIDVTACAQSILTLITFGDVPAADRVASWTIENLQRPDGGFAYQIHQRYKNRIVYTRWSVAWMFCALARLLREHQAAA